MRSLATYLRGLDPRLPRTVWLVQAGGVVNSLANGIVFRFAVICLHKRAWDLVRAGRVRARERRGGRARVRVARRLVGRPDRRGGQPPRWAARPGGGGRPL